MKSVLFSVLIAANLLQLTLPCFAQNESARIDSLARALFAQHELQGNILVTDKGKPVYEKPFGYADVSKQLPNTSSTSFMLASVSKIFTSVAILQLKEKGKLKLDASVSKYLPDFPYANISIRQLLSHTSGLPDYQIFEGPNSDEPSRIFSNADFIPAIRNYKAGLLFQPGERWSYSNVGFGLLALIVEKVSGIAFQDYLSRYVFRPANMKHTYVSSQLLHVADYAEALRLNGKKEEAVMMYKESLQLNPRNEGARKALKELDGN